MFSALEPTIKSGLQIGRGLSLLDNQTRLERVFREHARIYETIAAEDAEGARAAVKTHFHESLGRILSDEKTPKPLG